MEEIEKDSQCHAARDSLDDLHCEYCGDQLIVGTDKEPDAVLCADCSTPAVRFW